MKLNLYNLLLYSSFQLWPLYRCGLPCSLTGSTRCTVPTVPHSRTDYVTLKAFIINITTVQPTQPIDRKHRHHIHTHTHTCTLRSRRFKGFFFSHSHHVSIASPVSKEPDQNSNAETSLPCHFLLGSQLPTVPRNETWDLIKTRATTTPTTTKSKRFEQEEDGTILWFQ